MKNEEEFIVALHEAGHSVMAALFDRGPVHVAMFPDPKNPSVMIGRTDSLTGLEADEICPENVHECLMVALAGGLAEVLYTGNCGGFDDDVEDALATLRLINPSADYEELRDPMWECQLLLAEPTTWGRLLAVASTLQDRRELSAEEVLDVMQTSWKAEEPPFKPARLKIAKKDCTEAEANIKG